MNSLPRHGPKIGMYRWSRGMRIANADDRAQLKPPRRRVLMRDYRMYGTFRKAGTIINNAIVQSYFEHRQAAQDHKLDAWLSQHPDTENF